jgi:RNA polymerase sigma-70 factor (ECF subfamily)
MFGPSDWLYDETSMDETMMIENARRGDLDAFNQLILAYQNFLFSIAVRILDDNDKAEDAVQETMIRAFQKLSSFHGESLGPWLARITINICYDALRRPHRQWTIPLERRNAVDEEMEPGLWMADPSPSIEEAYEAHELDHAIETCLHSLKLKFRTVLVLIDVEKAIHMKKQPS